MWDCLDMILSRGLFRGPHWWDPILFAACLSVIQYSKAGSLSGTPSASAFICVHLACAFIVSVGILNYFIEKRKGRYSLLIIKKLLYCSASILLMLCYRFDRGDIFMLCIGFFLAVFQFPLLLVVIVIYNENNKGKK